MSCSTVFQLYQDDWKVCSCHVSCTHNNNIKFTAVAVQENSDRLPSIVYACKIHTVNNINMTELLLNNKLTAYGNGLSKMVSIQ